MASVFSGKAGRQSAMWSAGEAHQKQLGELGGIYGQGKGEADKYITEGRRQEPRRPAAVLSRRAVTTFPRACASANLQIGHGRSDQRLKALNKGYGQAIDAVGQYYGQGAEALNRSSRASSR